MEENNSALERERRLNVDLLNSIFPADIAQDLWLGRQVETREFQVSLTVLFVYLRRFGYTGHLQNITMLFSDIVGFTAICSKCSPMEVIQMLSNLYTKFDRQCGLYDVYKVRKSNIYFLMDKMDNQILLKVETIGDAYCVAGGLHRSTVTHAQQIAWMALAMMDWAQQVNTPLGEPIKVI